MFTTEHETIISTPPRFRQRSDSRIAHRPFEFKSTQIGPIHPAVEDVVEDVVEDLADDPADAGKGLFISLLNALHDSRRLQASRVIHQYRHLIAAPQALPTTGRMFGNSVQPTGKTKMTISDDSRRPSTKVRSWALIATVIVGFGILHVAAEIIVSQSDAPPTATSLTPSQGD